MQNRSLPFGSPVPGRFDDLSFLEIDRMLGLAGITLPCRRATPDLFFAESPDDVELAKSICADCPARAACLADALERREPWGVWGGELFIAGVVVPRKRPRGRPRKCEVAA
jgi:WhiB family transcriptional regulator, redox-sensing transcriptional regulator